MTGIKKTESKLKQKRKELKLKLREVAILTGQKIGSVGSAEYDGIKTVRVAKKYAQALGCKWQELLD